MLSASLTARNGSVVHGILLMLLACRSTGAAPDTPPSAAPGAGPPPPGLRREAEPQAELPAATKRSWRLPEPQDFHLLEQVVATIELAAHGEVWVAQLLSRRVDATQPMLDVTGDEVVYTLRVQGRGAPLRLVLGRSTFLEHKGGRFPPRLTTKTLRGEPHLEVHLPQIGPGNESGNVDVALYELLATGEVIKALGEEVDVYVGVECGARDSLTLRSANRTGRELRLTRSRKPAPSRAVPGHEEEACQDYPRGAVSVDFTWDGACYRPRQEPLLSSFVRRFPDLRAGCVEHECDGVAPARPRIVTIEGDDRGRCLRGDLPVRWRARDGGSHMATTPVSPLLLGDYTDDTGCTLQLRAVADFAEPDVGAYFAEAELDRYTTGWAYRCCSTGTCATAQARCEKLKVEADPAWRECGRASRQVGRNSDTDETVDTFVARLDSRDRWDSALLVSLICPAATYARARVELDALLSSLVRSDSGCG